MNLTSAIKIIRETCEVIWTVLVNTVMPGKLTKENWLKISDGFETRWNFNHCIGAIDGKRIEIEVNISKIIFKVIYNFVNIDFIF